MRILHVINNLNAGGAEKLLTDMLPLLKKQGHEVSVAISNGKKNITKFEKIFIESNITIINYRLSFYNPLLIVKLFRTIAKGKFNIVHSHLFPSQYWLALTSLILPNSIKLLKTEHSVFNNRKRYKILRPLEKFIYNRYDKIICITPMVKENLSMWLKSSNIEVINNGVNLEEINRAKKKPLIDLIPKLQRKYFTILMTARFDGVYKDHKMLIDALEIIEDNGIQLFFAGDGPMKENIKNYALSKNCADRIHFLGVRTDVYKLMSMVDLNVLCTNNEGLSGVALEGMASGKPFIGSAVPGVCDIVPDNCFLFPKKDSKTLAEKISKIRSNPDLSNYLTQKGLEHVKHFDISIMVEKYIETYKRVYSESKN